MSLTKEMLVNAFVNYNPSKLYMGHYGVVLIEGSEAEREIHAGGLFSSLPEYKIDYNQPLPGVDLTPLQCVVAKTDLTVMPDGMTVLYWTNKTSTSMLRALLVHASCVNLSVPGNRAAVRELLLKIENYIKKDFSRLLSDNARSPHVVKFKEYNQHVLSWLTCLHNNRTLPRDEFYEKIRVLMYSVKYSCCQDDSLFSGLDVFPDDPLDEVSQLNLELHALASIALDERDPEKASQQIKAIDELSERGADSGVKVCGRSALSLIHLESLSLVVEALFNGCKKASQALVLSEPAALKNLLYYCCALVDELAISWLVQLPYNKADSYYPFIKPTLSDRLFAYKKGSEVLGRQAFFFIQAVLGKNVILQYEKKQGVSSSVKSIELVGHQQTQYSDVLLISLLKKAMCARVLRRDGLMSRQVSSLGKAFNVREQGKLQQAVRDQYVLGEPFLLDNILRTNSKRTMLKDTKTFKTVRDYLKDWPISRSALAELKRRVVGAEAPVSPRNAVLYLVFESVPKAERLAIVQKHLIQPVSEAALVELNRALNLLFEWQIRLFKEQLVVIGDELIKADLKVDLNQEASPFVEVLKTSGSGKRNQNTTTYTTWVKALDDKARKQAKVGGEEKKRFTLSLIPSILFGPKQPALPQDQASGLLPSPRPGVHDDF